MRGEQIAIVIELFKQLGSPPLARGTVDIINELLAAIKDHPRLRGEQKSRQNAAVRLRGSPPLARGTG